MGRTIRPFRELGGAQSEIIMISSFLQRGRYYRYGKDEVVVCLAIGSRSVA